MSKANDPLGSDRMPGRYLMPCKGTQCNFPVTGCSGKCGWGRGHTTSWRSGVEKRKFRAFVSGLFERLKAQADYDNDPEPDCRHGCNGNCYESGSDRCNFTCHPERT